ncbi:MAG: hypothetical protein QOE33_2783 [Acidobacteriota bacterium]|nr:hypothetical protein [Acidobacteriota bacterium]
MADDTLLATLEQSLRQTRMTRNRLAARLTDLELEADKLRTEIGEMDAIASQTQAAMYRILSSVLARANPAPPSDADIESALRHDEVGGISAAHRIQSQQHLQQQQVVAPQPTYVPRPAIPPVHPETEAKSDRFIDRTIPQATTLILRESAVPLHVNEIYNRLLEGGFQFTGHNPTISIAVSLNRNRRFRKVAPGTFDLTIRDAAQAS